MCTSFVLVWALLLQLPMCPLVQSVSADTKLVSPCSAYAVSFFLAVLSVCHEDPFLLHYLPTLLLRGAHFSWGSMIHFYKRIHPWGAILMKVPFLARSTDFPRERQRGRQRGKNCKQRPPQKSAKFRARPPYSEFVLQIACALSSSKAFLKLSKLARSQGPGFSGLDKCAFVFMPLRACVGGRKGIRIGWESCHSMLDQKLCAVIIDH